VAIAILGDNLDNPSHRELNALIPRLGDEFGLALLAYGPERLLLRRSSPPPFGLMS
jgi:hypothetical protein